MVNLREVYRQAEEHTTALIVLLFGLLLLFVIGLSFVSGFTILAVFVSVGFLILTVVRPLWTLAILSVYLPFEPFILKFMTDEVFLFARFFSEVLIYVLAAVTIGLILTGKARMRSTPLSLPFVLFLVVLISSAVMNLVAPSIALFGIRQIIRFILLFFIVAYLYPPKKYIKAVVSALFVVLVVQSALGISQAIVGAPLDNLLLPSETRTFGDITITSGTVQFWDPGSRVFGTLGRYDRLGGFLYLLLLIGVGVFYEPRLQKYRKEMAVGFALGLPTLVLTFSRSSWFAFLFGFLFIALYIRRDRRVAAALGVFALLAVLFMAASGINVQRITEIPGQTLVERFYETFSFARWEGEYYGLGRTFWFVQTIATVLPAAPLFGFGPGQYGGGVVSALQNTAVYDQLGLPFGVYGTEGYIDNNWFSLLGEVGIIGMLFYLWMFVALFRYALWLYHQSQDGFTRAFAIGFCAILIGVSFNAFTVTLFEIRTTAYYLWFFAGCLYVLGERTKQTTFA